MDTTTANQTLTPVKHPLTPVNPTINTHIIAKTKAKPGRKKGTPQPEKVDLNKAVKLRIENKLEYSQIAEIMGVTRQAVWKRMRPLREILKDPEATAMYRENRAEIMDSVERELVTHMVDSGKLKDASVNNLAYAVSQLNNIGRLERGLSTANISTVIGLREEDRAWLAQIAGEFVSRQFQVEQTDQGQAPGPATAPDEQG